MRGADCILARERQGDGPLAVAGYEQPKRVAAIAYGPALDEQWGQPTRAVDFFDVVVEGKGGHAARPQTTVDPIAVATQVHQAFHCIGGKRERLAGGIADAFPGEDGVAGQCLDQVCEGKAAGHVGVEVWFRRTQRAEAAGGGCLGRGHHGSGDGADFHANAAWEGEPVRGGGKVEGEHGVLLRGSLKAGQTPH